MQSALSSAYAARQVSQIFAPDDEYQVMMQVAPEFQQNPAALSMLYVQGAGGKLIPLSSVVTTRQTVGPASINHISQLPSVTLSFNLQPGVALGDALARVQEMARQTLPDTVTATPQGTAQAFEESMRAAGFCAGDFRDLVVLGILYGAQHRSRSSRVSRRPASARCDPADLQTGLDIYALRHHMSSAREENGYDGRLRHRGRKESEVSQAEHLRGCLVAPPIMMRRAAPWARCDAGHGPAPSAADARLAVVAGLSLAAGLYVTTC